MEVCRNVHQIRVDFQITETVKRYAYVYLVTGQSCCLIDSGVAGSEKVIERYMRDIGRDMTEIKAVFLTHAHPDHIGGAAAVQNNSGCKVYASEEAKRWTEDIDLQFQERPIPGFYTLVNEAVSVDETVRDNDCIFLEDGITFQVLDSKGHSNGSVSYLLKERGVLFCGDAIPVQDEFPIFTELDKSRSTLERLGNLSGTRYCCPAWDHVYGEQEFSQKVSAAETLLRKLEDCVRDVHCKYPEISEKELAEAAGNRMGWKDMAVNPLFLRSIKACLESE